MRSLLTLTAQNWDYHISPTGVRMCSGAYASSHQDTDDTGGVGVGRSYALGSNIEGPPVLTWMCVQAISTAHDTPLAHYWVVERLFIGYRTLKKALRTP